MQARLLPLMTLVALAAGLVGCNTVPRVEFDALQTKHNELSDQNAVLNKELELAKGRDGQLLADLSAASNRATRAQERVTQLQNELAGRPKVRPAPPVGPLAGRERVEINLGSDGLFGAGMASLKRAGKARVAQLASQIKREHPGATVLVYGHTDSDKITKSKWKDNLELSAQRAMAVARALIKAGVPARSVETIAIGEHRPVASNKTSAGKARNRRVVVKILK